MLSAACPPSPLTCDSWPISVTSDKGLKGFDTPGSCSRSPWDVAQGLTAAPGALVCQQLQGSTGCQACLAAVRQQPAGQSAFVQPWAPVCTLADAGSCSSWQTTVAVARREVEGKRLCGGFRIRKEQQNSKPCKTRCCELCCSPVTYSSLGISVLLKSFLDTTVSSVSFSSKFHMFVIL